MTAHRIVGDWGTTRLRLFKMAADGTHEKLEGPGFGATGDGAAATLAQLATKWGDQAAHITLCGMAGARGGLIEAPYVACPASLNDWRARTVRDDIGQHAVQVAAGLRYLDRDVMRGEETQIFGALALQPALQSGDQTIILPGTHSKWVSVCDGVITRFKTYFTGELFALLHSGSTLFKAAAPTGSEQDSTDGWTAGLAAAQSHQGIVGSLFETRAAQLLCKRNATWAEGFLSGLLIGSEVDEALDQSPVTANAVLVGSSALLDRYSSALAARGVTSQIIDGDAAVLAGLGLIND